VHVTMKQNQDFPLGPRNVSISKTGDAPDVISEIESSESSTDIASYFRPQYSATIHGKIVVSSSVLELIKQGASAEINFAALNVFLRSGFYVGTKTLYRDIHTREVPNPASLVVKPSDGNRSAIVEGYIELFRQAVQRQIQRFGSDRICMGLSGGRDSRHILLELCRVGVKPDVCWTVDLPNSPSELTIAQRLTHKAGVPHISLTAASSVETEQYKNQVTNFESTEHGWSVAAIPIIQRHLMIYDGMAGDVLSAGHFLTDEGVRLVHQGRIDEFVEKVIVRPGPVPLVRDQNLFPVQTALEVVSAEFRRHLAMPNPIGSFYLWNRTRRTIGSSAFGLLCPSGQQTCVPYLDGNLFAFLSAIPDTMLVDHELHTDTIRRAFPEYADIPYAFKIKPQNLSHWNRRLAVGTARYLAIHPSPLLSRRTALLLLARGFLSPTYLADVNWVHAISMYLAEAGSLNNGLSFGLTRERAIAGTSTT